MSADSDGLTEIRSKATNLVEGLATIMQIKELTQREIDRIVHSLDLLEAYGIRLSEAANEAKKELRGKQ